MTVGDAGRALANPGASGVWGGDHDAWVTACLGRQALGRQAADQGTGPLGAALDVRAGVERVV